MTGWWFGTCFIFSYIWNNNLSEGVGNPPSRPRVRTRMSVSRAHAHAGLARARALIARLFFLAQVNENDVSAAARLRTLCGSPAHAVAGLGPCRCKAPFSSKIEAVAQFDGSLLL